jgi:ribosomal protein S18 acetylase RimI-like enzyme
LSEPVEIRQARHSDAAGIAAVHVRTWQAAYRGLVPDAHLDSMSVESRTEVWRDALARGEPENVWVAAVGSEIAGWIAFGACRDADGTRTGEIEAVYVAAQYWGGGLGRALWLQARSCLTQRGFRRVTLWVLLENARAIRFYRAAGFAPEPGTEKEIDIGGRALMEMRYAVDLD